MSQAIRDLEWAIHSPSLIVQPHFCTPPAFNLGVVAPGELDAFLEERRSHRVGRYFESLVLFWLEQVRKVEIIASNQQVRDGNRTLGEIDFIFRDEDSVFNHWETAVKFFLHCPDHAPSHYPGPNPTDNFEKKIKKLFNRQLGFSEQHFPDVTVRRAFVRGRIFYHPDIGEPETRPERLADDHLRGSWIRESELEWLTQLDDEHGEILMKPHWLTPHGREVVAISDLIVRLQTHFRQTRSPALVAVGDHHVFVVDDEWPVGPQLRDAAVLPDAKAGGPR